jgi:hypothetical protein
VRLLHQKDRKSKSSSANQWYQQAAAVPSRTSTTRFLLFYFTCKINDRPHFEAEVAFVVATSVFIEDNNATANIEIFIFLNRRETAVSGVRTDRKSKSSSTLNSKTQRCRVGLLRPATSYNLKSVRVELFPIGADPVPFFRSVW